MDDTHEEVRFRALFEAEARPLFGYALRRMSRPEDAADVVAETFLVAWRRLSEVPVGPDGRLWLYGVARRVVANHRRGDVRRSRLTGRLGEQLALALAQPVFRSENAGIVTAALDRLDDEERELLRLTNWEGLTPTELARAMDIPASTIRSRLQRARERLRSELERNGWESGQCNASAHLAARPATTGLEASAEGELL